MDARSFFSSVRRDLFSSLYQRKVTLINSAPIASFTFDDFPRSALTVGGSIMRDFGVRGTYYVALGLMNTENALGEQFRLDDLHSLVAVGHELATHTFNHLSSRNTPVRTFVEDVRRGYTAINELEPLRPTSNFAYPYGNVTLRAKRTIGKELRSCRGIYPGINGPSVDLNLLRANSLYGDSSHLGCVSRLIDMAVDQKGWLIFYTHDVRPKPSPYGCTPGLLESAIRMLLSRGVRVLPVENALSELEVARTPRSPEPALPARRKQGAATV